MSLIIKGEKMPKSCEYCLLSHYYPETEKVWCNAGGRIIAENYDPFVNLKIEKPEWCPLEEAETGWGELFLLDGMSQFIKKEMDELLKSPWAQDKTLTPHDMAVKEAFATVKDLILSKFEIKEGWENLIHGVEVNK